MTGFGDMIYERGIQQGMQQGIQQGRHEGMILGALMSGKTPEEVSKMLNLPLEEKSSGTADDCEQVVKVNYRYKINWELGALIKLIIKEAMHIIRA